MSLFNSLLIISISQCAGLLTCVTQTKSANQIVSTNETVVIKDIATTVFDFCGDEWIIHYTIENQSTGLKVTDLQDFGIQSSEFILSTDDFFGFNFSTKVMSLSNEKATQFFCSPSYFHSTINDFSEVQPLSFLTQTDLMFDNQKSSQKDIS